jgi:hypothetical protein
MKSDLVRLAQLTHAHPELADLLMSRSIAVANISNCDITDKTFAEMSNSFADLISQMQLADDIIPYTASPFRPQTGMTYPASMSVGANDITVPIRFFSNGTDNIIPEYIPIAALQSIIRFQNNTITGDIPLDIFYLDYQGRTLDGLTRNMVVTPSAGANSASEFVAFSASLALRGNIDTSSNVMDLSNVQSSGYFKMTKLNTVVNVSGTTTASFIGTVDYSAFGAFPNNNFSFPSTIVAVFRGLATVAQIDVTVTPLYATPDNIKSVINLILAKLTPAGK